MLLRLAINQCASVFATYLDSNGISPEALESAILQNQPVVINALQQVGAGGIARVRSIFGGFADQLSREQVDPGGQRWHPYLAVLQHPVLSVQHRRHVEAILRHLDWYRAQMDAAVQYLRGQ